MLAEVGSDDETKDQMEVQGKERISNFEEPEKQQWRLAEDNSYHEGCVSSRRF